MEGLDTARSRYVKAIILRNPSSVMPTMQSQVTGSRGNIFFSSSREQFTSSVACKSASPCAANGDCLPIYFNSTRSASTSEAA